MDNVIPLKKEDTRLVWMCALCNCSSFYLYDDKTIECAGCHHPSEDNGEWVINLPNAPPVETITKDDGNLVNVVAWGSEEFSRRRVLKEVTKWNDDNRLTAMVGWSEDGGMRSWSSVNNEAQKQWLLRKISELAEHISKIDTTGN
jgi:hypothetical protein